MTKHLSNVLSNYWKQNISPIYIGGKDREEWEKKTSSSQKWKAHFVYILSIAEIISIGIVLILVALSVG